MAGAILVTYLAMQLILSILLLFFILPLPAPWLLAAAALLTMMQTPPSPRAHRTWLALRYTSGS